MKNSIITFKEGRIRDTTTNEPLEINFRREDMKKLMKDRLERNNSSFSKEAETYIIEVEYIKVKIFIHISKEVIMRKIQAIRRLIKWNDLVDATTIKAYLVSKHRKKESYDVSVEIKRDRTSEDKEVADPTNKKKIPSNRKIAPRKGLIGNTRQK